MTNLKIITWNVNGIRAIIKKIDLNKFLKNTNPDIIAFGETKLSCPDQNTKDLLKVKIKNFDYRYYSTCSKKKGYSGTAVWSKIKPLNVKYGIGIKKHDNEGRIITLEFKNFFFIHVYVPNSGQVLQRLKYRTNEWEPDIIKYLTKLKRKKNIIYCGDLNVAHQEIDLHSPKTNKKHAGFTEQERECFSTLLSKVNLIDTFRYFNPNQINAYTYWTYLKKSRARNKGWRIDYFLVNNKFLRYVKKSEIISKQMGSDHAPILLHLKIPTL